ncbi:hypothetical protein P170DRAFT_235915 [Aspergillus steynii IBT 23096]|uniref:Uncharacterized protein n=1 Tax=Aspergillus steynii IBT 23096 TaxID=1392250 RepID=A0A2I2G2T3_9EURO|nr:uncharacterized protein P170DRAFT_235915 [Aspergillus steynii IBT 23096]PLB47181.1 hypothetical protein P170DRAFT_235915 [Aspergillus steynii IBT 23096]
MANLVWMPSAPIKRPDGPNLHGLWTLEDPELTSMRPGCAPHSNFAFFNSLFFFSFSFFPFSLFPFTLFPYCLGGVLSALSASIVLLLLLQIQDIDVLAGHLVVYGASHRCDSGRPHARS